MVQQIEVKRAKEMHKAEILAKPNVVGVGTGFRHTRSGRTEEVCVVALVRRKMPQAALQESDLVPREVNGVRTDVVEVGELKALQARTDRWRPAPGGVSVGHYLITAGTFGCVVRDQASGERLLLSNNHVLANSNIAAPGDAILQPGPTDGGQRAEDTLALLERFVPLVFNREPGSCDIAAGVAGVANALARLVGSGHQLEVFQGDQQTANLVDAAVARPLDPSALLDDILEIGQITGTTLPVLGMAVRKSGRTTGLTEGTITVLNTTVEVSYGPGRSARFEDQLVTSPMSQGGDSGSCLVEADATLAVGLLFAGSDRATIHNPIQSVLESLEVTL